MIIKPVRVHKMYEEFHRYPRITYVGEFNDKKKLINIYNSLGEKFINILGTYQWKMGNSDEVYFVEQDAFYIR